jgi:hypothetical protein
MENSRKRSVLVLCDDGWLCKGCPEIFVDDSAESLKQVSITDDFGQVVEMSKGQFQVLLKKAKKDELFL